MRLLITRPEPDGERTAQALRQRGHQVLLAPLLRIECIAEAALGEAALAERSAGIIITSVNALRALAHHPQRHELAALPLFAVGRRTAGAALAFGFGDVTPADGNAQALVRLLAGRHAGGSLPLMHLAGEDRAVDLAGELAARGVPVRTVVVYRAVAMATFPASALAALREGAIDGVLHFSRRSAAAYLACVAAAGLGSAALAPIHFCLSEKIAAPLAAAGAAAVRVAPLPDERALVDLVRCAA